MKKLDKPNLNHRARRIYGGVVLTLTLCAVLAIPAFAADDPLAIVNNLSDFIFSAIKAIGVIILAWGIVQVVCPSSPTMPASAPRAFCVCSAGW